MLLAWLGCDGSGSRWVGTWVPLRTTHGHASDTKAPRRESTRLVPGLADPGPASPQSRAPRPQRGQGSVEPAMYLGAHWHRMFLRLMPDPHQAASLQPLSPAGALPETQGQSRGERAGKCVLGRGLVPAGHQAGDSLRWPGCNSATLGAVPVRFRKARGRPPGAEPPPAASVPTELRLGFLPRPRCF